LLNGSRQPEPLDTDPLYFVASSTGVFTGPAGFFCVQQTTVKEPAKTTNPEFSVEKIVARMQNAAARKGQFEEFASSEVVTSAEFRPVHRNGQALAELDIQPFTLQPPFHPHRDSRYHVNDLLKYHDRNFIQNAYRAILRRGPDATGYKTFIESLRSGRLNKIDILAALRYSSEGRAKKVEIEGLRTPALIRKAYRVPGIGYLLNLAVALARLPASIRSEQQFAAHVLAQQELIAEHLNHLGRTIRLHGAGVSQSLDIQSQSVKQLEAHWQEQLSQLSQLRDEFRHQVEELRHQQQQFSEETRQSAQRLQQQVLNRLTEQTTRIEVRFLEQVRNLEQRINEQTSEVVSRFTELTGLVDDRTRETNLRLDEEVARRGREEVKLQAEISRQELEDARLNEVINQRDQEIRARLSEAVAHWEQNLKTLQMLALQWRAEISATESELRQMTTELRQTDTVHHEQLELTATTIKRDVDRLYQKQQAVTTELTFQEQRVATLLAEARRRLPGPFDEEQLQTIAAEQEHTLDAFYASFDEQFRGSREEIKERLQVYLPIIEPRGIGSEAMPLLDVGCGRGEWLELLQGKQFTASGVDANRVLVEQCRSRGLSVVEDDLRSYLRSLPDNSLGAVTGFHIVEHLPLEMLIEFLNQTVRILKPGGVVIFETPNPQNVLVGSCNFYFDPTHRNPLPNQVMSFLLESRGFVEVEILRLNPSDDLPVADDSDLARRFNHYFYGPMDYAVIGWKA